MTNRLKDEDYWWDILKTVISFSITGILAYIAALTLGYVKTPAGQQIAVTSGLAAYSSVMGFLGAKYAHTKFFWYVVGISLVFLVIAVVNLFRVF